jgi:hypothetical protein
MHLQQKKIPIERCGQGFWCLLLFLLTYGAVSSTVQTIDVKRHLLRQQAVA